MIQVLEDIIEKMSVEDRQTLIKQALKTCLKEFDGKFKPTPLLVNSVYKILHLYLVEGKKYVICEFPTGSGKTIIAFLTYFCMAWISNYMTNMTNQGKSDFAFDDVPDCLAYFLTSSKILQDQIERDIDRFEFQKYMVQIKGIVNYPCSMATKRMNTEPKFKELVLQRNPNATWASYEFRPCKNKTGEAIEKLPCFPTCAYKNTRLEAAYKSLSILNYAYFLNVMRSDYNPYFATRSLTISDEAHLLPDIICNTFNHEITPFYISRLEKLLYEYMQVIGDETLAANIRSTLNGALRFFELPITMYDMERRVRDYINTLTQIAAQLRELISNAEKSNLYGDSFNLLFKDRFTDIKDLVEEQLEACNHVQTMNATRKEDLFVSSEDIPNQFTLKKHIFRDLSEHEMSRKHFLSKIDRGLFMSATIGNGDEYAHMMGMEPDEYYVLKARSTFDFSKSPIYLMNSGKLNYANIKQNLPRVIQSTLKICREHADEKGVIHTSTFSITNAIRQAVIQDISLANRFLFYNDSHQREEVLKKFLASSEPLILVGPSLYEGIDLKDDLARFQILIKVPFAQLNDYIKKKMARYPFWYRRNCIEKVVQAIGRSNRHPKDWSKIYLMDSMFSDIMLTISEDNPQIEERLEWL